MDLADALDTTKWCSRCGGRLSVTHSYEVPAGSVQGRECPRREGGCGQKFTAVIQTVLEENTGRGKGAWAVAQRLRGESSD